MDRLAEVRASLLPLDPWWGLGTWLLAAEVLWQLFKLWSLLLCFPLSREALREMWNWFHYSLNLGVSLKSFLGPLQARNHSSILKSEWYHGGLTSESKWYQTRLDPIPIQCFQASLVYAAPDGASGDTSLTPAFRPLCLAGNHISTVQTEKQTQWVRTLPKAKNLTPNLLNLPSFPCARVFVMSLEMTLSGSQMSGIVSLSFCQ